MPISNTQKKPIFLCVQSEHTKTALLSVLRSVFPNVGLKSFKSLTQMVDELIVLDTATGSIFIEYGFPIREIASSLEKIKNQPKTKPEAVILVIDSDLINNDLISNYMRIGISGFVTRPFSESSVINVFHISERLSEMGSIATLKVATRLEIIGMMEDRGECFKGSSILSTVKRACDKFEKENPGVSTEQLAHSYARMSPQERLKPKLESLYKGPSERVKNILRSLDKKK